MARNAAQENVNQSAGSLPKHHLLYYMVPPNKWPEQQINSIGNNFLKLLEVYVDDFCTLVQTTNPAELRHVSNSLLHAIYDLFPPVGSKHHNLEEPMSIKKLRQRDGEWDNQKEILGWLFDEARRILELPRDKLEDITQEIKTILRMKRIPFTRFWRIVGKLWHAAIGLPAGRGLCLLFNRTLAQEPRQVHMGPKGAVHRAFRDCLRLLGDMTKRPTHVNELVVRAFSDLGNVDASDAGVGGVWMSIKGEYPNTV